VDDFIPIPDRIRIRVTGHRTLPDHAAIVALMKKGIDAEFERLFPGEPRRNNERIRCGIFRANCGVDPKPIKVLP
jgi:hypothetical protein